MISKDGILNYMRQDSYKPLEYLELVGKLSIGQGDDEVRFKKCLGQLEKDGYIIRTRKNKYGLPEMMNLTRGVMRLSPRGYGLLLPEEPGRPEIFVYGKKLNGAMHNDKVMVRIRESEIDGQRPEGTVIRVISRANQQMVGTYRKGRSLAQVIPDDSRQIYPIYVRPTKKIKVNNGDKVLVTITAWPDGNNAAEGKILEVLGGRGQPGTDLQVLLKKHGLAADFTSPVLQEAEKVALPVNPEEISRRRDLRDLSMVTIDGEDAKDLDDAVSVNRIPAGYRLGVHIADVSHYVKEDSRLDKEAGKRGTSVYLVDTVLPMLPRELSNGICSLNAGVERLAVTCMMDIDKSGKVLDYEIFKSVIKVQERMTYKDVNRLLAGEEGELKQRYESLVPDFFLMKELADILRQERMSRGYLDFDFPEAKVIVDEKGFPVEIRKRESGAGENLIEDFMIKANEVVAEHLYMRQIPVLYRVHEKPEEESINKLNLVLGVFGHKIRSLKPEPLSLQKVLHEIKGRPEEQLISLLLLRSMKHARYAPQALGHFGLASRYYCHFTSPIRRYPDLIVHRVLSSLLEGGMNAKRRASLEKKMTGYGEHSTLQEMKAEEAEREYVAIKKAQYMEQFVGEEFTGRIASVQSFGFFIELANTVEGLVHISSIADDYYEFNERNYTLIGRHSGRKFAIGDAVQVQLVRVDVDDAKVDFELVTQNNEVEAKPAEGNEASKNNGNGKSKDGFASRKKSKSNGKSNGKARRRSRRDGK
ncbi:MAG: ribonuclease R [Syntrophomonadaceae bacterium]